MKKVLSLILFLSLIFSYGVLAVSAAEDELIINVATDIHLNNAWEKPIPVRNNTDGAYSHVASQGKLNSESKAIIAAFLDNAAKDKSEVVLIPGDLADYGLESEMEDVAEMLAEFEKNTGKQVYVIPGNHDVSKSSVSLFMKSFAEFGYNEATVRDENSASYVAELPDGYRLLAIDSTLQGSGKCGISGARLEWIRQQAQQAKKDGKKTIAMMHHNLMTHLVIIGLFHPSSVVSDSLGLKELFAECGIKYIFTGHTHTNDIASYTTENGEVIYDIVTSSLNVYPCSYRTVTFGDKVEIKTSNVDKIVASDVPTGMSDEAFELMSTDFNKYAKVCAELGLENEINGMLEDADFFKKTLNVTDESAPEISAVLDEITPKLKEVLNMPLYAEDETEEGKSIESILASYKVTIPDSKYYDVMSIAIEIYNRHNAGDEKLNAYSNEVVLASKGIGAVLAYALSDVSTEQYTQVLTFLCDFVKVELPKDFLSHISTQIDRFEGIELVVSTAILPLMLKVTVDEAPGDLNVTLPGYAELIEAPEAEKTFWEKVQEFFIGIFEFIMSLFAFM